MSKRPFRIVVSYGYDIHSTYVSTPRMKTILDGKKVRHKGSGFHWDGEFDQDYWSFNGEGEGSLYIGTENGGTVFDGDIKDGEVRIDIDDEWLYLDRGGLNDRGWTATLIKKFLPKPDRYGQTAHYLSSVGKGLYSFFRVAMIEQSEEFKTNFQKSLKRRGFADNAFESTRKSTVSFLEAINKLKSVKENFKAPYTDENLEKAASAIQSARSQGYRTPHIG